MSTTTITSANVISKPVQKITSQQGPSVPRSTTQPKKSAHLGITISWAGAPWPAPGTPPDLLIFTSGESIVSGGAGC